jgi:hypothetical protein
MHLGLNRAWAVSRHDPAQRGHRADRPHARPADCPASRPRRSQQLHDTASMWTLTPSSQATWPNVITPDEGDGIGQDCPMPGAESRRRSISLAELERGLVPKPSENPDPSIARTLPVQPPSASTAAWTNPWVRLERRGPRSAMSSRHWAAYAGILRQGPATRLRQNCRRRRYRRPAHGLGRPDCPAPCGRGWRAIWPGFDGY